MEKLKKINPRTGYKLMTYGLLVDALTQYASKFFFEKKSFIYELYLDFFMGRTAQYESDLN